jgi:hypothetical protein
VEKLNLFLHFNEFGSLEDTGRISAEVAGLLLNDKNEKFVEI